MNFLYFIESAAHIFEQDKLIKAAGLEYAIHTPGLACVSQTTQGPSGGPGFVFALPPAGNHYADVRYVPDAQTWRKGPKGEDGKPRYWIGLATGERPGPDDLQRQRVISGHSVRLRDKNDYVIPIARSIVRGSTLPKDVLLGDDGETFEFSELPEFVGICHDAETIFDGIRKGGEIHMPFQEAARIVIDALAINYRVGKLEVAMLGLLSEVEMWEVMEAICDMPTVRKMNEELAAKNSAAAGSSSNDGKPAA